MYTSFIGLTIDLDDEERVTEALAAMDNVVEIYTMMGPFELFVKVYAENIRKLESSIAEIQALPGVLRSFNFLTVQKKK
jgi:DNA-binding Lrp family transcriptional regulator